VARRVHPERPPPNGRPGARPPRPGPAARL
jgi:hypothetical protein